MKIRVGLGMLVALGLFAAGCGGEDKNTVTTESGLKYVDLEKGEGEAVKAGDFVEVHYTGTLGADGTKFDSSHDRKEPFVFRVGAGQVIKGWDEGILGMKPKGKRKLIVPSKLGYGERGSPPRIPPDADLVFEVELLRILDPIKTEDTQEGTGDMAREGQTVEVHYVGKLKDTGEPFDSSLDRGQPISLRLDVAPMASGGDPVFPRLVESITGMKVGGKRKLTIPWYAAYGAEGLPADQPGPPKIPPKADLVFEVELLRIK